MIMILPPELFNAIIIFLDKELGALYACALVCHAFHKAATPLLYKRIHVSPPKVGLAWQVVEDTLGRKPFAASRLPSHTTYVEEFFLDGYLTKIRPSRQTPVPIIDKIPEAFKIWQNLRTVTLTPAKATGPALLNVVKALRQCPSLRAVTVNEFAMEKGVILELVELSGLQELTLSHPTGALFTVLLDWLMRIQDTLHSFHLLGDCGCLTPGILRMITPPLEDIRSLALGLSYSITNTDLFACLSELPKLRSLHFHYYRQHRSLPSGPILPSMQHLTVLHAPLFCKEDAGALSAWIRRVSSTSPLETLQTISSDDSGPSLCFDGLITHLASQHRRTLLTLRMPRAYVRGPALHTLLKQCTAIQAFALTVAFSTLKTFSNLTNEGMRLRTVSIAVCDQPKLVIEQREAQKLMQRVPRLRFVTVNSVSWKGEWVLQKKEEGLIQPEFVVSLVANAVKDQNFEDT